MTQDRESIVRKVRALLSTAESLAEQGNAEAAANYIAKAHELRQSHEIEDAALRDAASLESEEVVSDVVLIPGAHSKRRTALAWSIAKGCNCSGYMFKGYQNSYQLHIYGTKGDIEYAKMLIGSLMSQVDRSMRKDFKSLKGSGIHGKTFAVSYYEGFRSRIAHRLEESNRVVQAQASTLSTSTALVLVKRAQRADEEMKAKVKLRNVNMGQTNSHRAWAQGSQAADRASLAKGAVNGSERKALA